jgi:hypothetical protein
MPRRGWLGRCTFLFSLQPQGFTGSGLLKYHDSSVAEWIGCGSAGYQQPQLLAAPCKGAIDGMTC